MSSPLVDVIVPLYNKAAVVARTVSSVLRQDFEDFRLIVVDDGSTDAGPDVVRGFADARMTLIRQANAGPGAARNHGLHAGSAPLIVFLDADDEWLPSFLGTMTGLLREHPACALAVASYFWGPQRENKAEGHRAAGLRTGVWRCPTNIAFPRVKAAVDACHSSSVLARRPVIERLGGFYDRDRCTYGEDSWLWLRLLMQEPIYYLVEPLVWVHTDASALSVGRRTRFPVPPIVEHVEQVLAECPPSHRELLENYLDWYTLLIAWRQAHQGRGRSARRLIRGRRRRYADDPEMRAAFDRTRRVAWLWPLLVPGKILAQLRKIPARWRWPFRRA